MAVDSSVSLSFGMAWKGLKKQIISETQNPLCLSWLLGRLHSVASCSARDPNTNRYGVMFALLSFPHPCLGCQTQSMTEPQLPLRSCDKC